MSIHRSVTISARLVIYLVSSPPGAQAAEPEPASAAIEWFRATEQALLDSVASGDKASWERVMDPSCIVTTEEGEVLDKRSFLEGLAPLPSGLEGGITVKDLTVQTLPEAAIVRYLAEEWEEVFGQKLATSYRVTNTYRLDGEEWKMVGSHFSVVTRDPRPQKVSTKAWPSFVGRYRLLPDGWTFHVVLREGTLYGGRDTAKLRPLIPLTPDAFVLSGSLR
jgi:hypothetical protein